MEIYRVYYTTNRFNREFTKDQYLIVGASNRIEALREAFDNVESAVKWGAVVRVSLDEQPIHLASKSTKIEAKSQVHVCWWYNEKRHAGERFGEFSQQAYDVIASDATWTTIRDSLGRKHTVATTRTRLAEVAKAQDAA